VARLVAAGVKLRDQVNARWPDRDTASDGWIADGNHDPASFHQPDADGWVRALDLDENLGERGAMRVLADQLAAHCRRGEPGSGRILHIVYEDQVASGTPGKGHPDYWRFRGSGYGHTQHMHISFTDAARRDGRPFPLDILESDMPLSDDDVKRIAAAVWNTVIKTGWQNDGTFDATNRQDVRALTALSDARGVARKIAYQGSPTTDEAAIADAVVDEIADRIGE
jgi:hypothetical protein